VNLHDVSPSYLHNQYDDSVFLDSALPDFRNDEGWDALANDGGDSFTDTKVQLEGTEPSADLEGGVDYPRNGALMSPSMASGVIHDAASICTLPSLSYVRTNPLLNSGGIPDADCSTLLNIHTLRWDVQEPVRAEDEVSPEVGSGGSRSACTRSASLQPLVRVSFSPRKESILPKSYVAFREGLTKALPSRLSSGFSY
jgi:hypothetical protein